MKILKAIKPVFLNGRIIEPGGKFSCPDDHAAKLVESESASIDQGPEDNLKETTARINDWKKLESMLKDDLLKLANEKGIEGLTDKDKKDEIIDAILSAG